MYGSDNRTGNNDRRHRACAVRRPFFTAVNFGVAPACVHGSTGRRKRRDQALASANDGPRIFGERDVQPGNSARTRGDGRNREAPRPRHFESIPRRQPDGSRHARDRTRPRRSSSKSRPSRSNRPRAPSRISSNRSSISEIESRAVSSETVPRYRSASRIKTSNISHSARAALINMRLLPYTPHYN